MGEDVKNKRVNIYIDNSAAENALEVLQVKADAFNASIQKNRDSLDALKTKIADAAAAGKDVTALQTKYDSLDKNIKAATKSLNDNLAAQTKLKEQITNGVNPSFNQQQRYVTNLLNQLKQLSVGSAEYNQKLQEYKKANTVFQNLRNEMELTQKVQTSWFKQAATIGAGVVVGNTIQTAIASIGSYFSNIISGNAKLSDSLADLQRVAGLTKDEVKNLYAELGGIDTRTSRSGLIDIAIIAGKLGVAKNDIAGFTQAVDQLVVALGDELGNADQITTELGKILNVFDGSINAQNISTLGNAIVDLANKGVATGPFLVDFTQRVAGIAKTANLSLDSVLGLAAGLEESGAKVESSATAIQKLITSIGEDVPAAAKIAGVPLETFNQLFAEKPQEALLLYAAGLQKNKTSFAEVAKSFKDAGEDGARTIAVLATLGQKTDFFRQKMDDAGVSIKNTDAIQGAFNLKNETLGAELDKLGKKIGQFFTNSFLTNMLSDWVKGFNDATDGVKSAREEYESLNSSVDNLQKNMLPLINRYDELKTKTKLSKDEQTEINGIISTIASNMPYAITEWDKYGNAIGISTDKAREFIEIQKSVLRVKNKEQIDATNNTIAQLQKEIDYNQRWAQGIYKQGQDVKKQYDNDIAQGYHRSADEATKAVSHYNESAASILNKNKELNQQLIDQQNYLKNLKGEDIVIPQAKTKKEADPPHPPQSKDVLKQQAKDAKDAKAELDKLKTAFDNFLDDINKDNASSLTPEAQALKEFADNLQKLQEGLSNKFIDQNGFIKELNILKDTYTAKIKKIKDDAANDPIEVPVEIIPPPDDGGPVTSKELDAYFNKIKLHFGDWLKDAFSKENWLDSLNSILDAASQAASIIGTFNENKNEQEQRQLDRETAQNDIRKNSYQQMLNGRLISQQEYQQRINKIDLDAEAKKEALAKKQFERNKRLQLAQAVITGGQAVLKTLQEFGPPIPPNFAGIIAMAFTVATNLAQLTAIASAKYARGGKLNGPSHDNGGMPVLNQHGQKVAEMEGGEGILKKSAMYSRLRFTATGTPSEIASTLNRYYGGVGWDSTATLRPAYMARPNYNIDYSGIQTAYNHRGYYAAGGRFAADGNTGSNRNMEDMLQQQQAINVMLMQSIQALNEQLKQPIRGDWSLKQLDDAQAQRDRIKKNSEFK